MEEHSGVNVQARQRLQLNFIVKKDTLFNYLPGDYFITPLTFIKRESIMSKQNVRDILGPLYLAKTARVAGLATMTVVGGLLIILSIIMFLCMRKVRKEEDYVIFDEKPSYEKMDMINATKLDTFLGNSSSRD